MKEVLNSTYVEVCLLVYEKYKSGTGFVLFSHCHLFLNDPRKFPEKVTEKNDDASCDSSSSNESEDSLADGNIKSSDLLYKAKNGTKCKKRKVPRVIRYVKYNKKKDTENYFREQLMLFVPWRNEQNDLLGTFNTFEAHYKSIQKSLMCMSMSIMLKSLSLQYR